MANFKLGAEALSFLDTKLGPILKKAASDAGLDDDVQVISHCLGMTIFESQKREF